MLLRIQTGSPESKSAEGKERKKTSCRGGREITILPSIKYTEASQGQCSRVGGRSGRRRCYASQSAGPEGRKGRQRQRRGESDMQCCNTKVLPEEQGRQRPFRAHKAEPFRLWRFAHVTLSAMVMLGQRQSCIMGNLRRGEFGTSPVQGSSACRESSSRRGQRDVLPVSLEHHHCQWGRSQVAEYGAELSGIQRGNTTDILQTATGS